MDRHNREPIPELVGKRHAAVELLDDVVGRSDSSTVVPAAARFQIAGFRWKPTPEQLEAVIKAHDLRNE